MSAPSRTSALVARIRRQTEDGLDRIRLAFVIFFLLMLLPYPWADELGDAYFVYVLVVVGVAVGTILVLMVRGIAELNRTARRARPNERRHP